MASPKDLLNEIATSRLSSLFKMTFPVVAFAFAFVLSFAQIGEAIAKSDCATGEKNCWDCGKTADDLCTARLNTSTKALNITGSGEMRDYQGAWNNGNPILNTPWGMDTFTSVSVQGVKNIGRSAFEYARKNLRSVEIGDSVTSIGHGAFDAAGSLISIKFPDSIINIDGSAFYNTGISSAVFVPESVTNIGTGGAGNGAFESSCCGQKYTLYCAATTPCYAKTGTENIKTYTKDENGVYKIGNNYYASPDDMLANRVCGSGATASQACIEAAAAYQDQKAESMAGGALCATKEGCLSLIDMANKKKVCSSIADCRTYAENNKMVSILCGDTYLKTGVGCVTDCGDGWLEKSNVCIDAKEGCGKYYYKKQNGCVSFEEGCGSGWLEKNRECIEASNGCGENYRDLGGWCNRVIYTPAEAAPLLTDENNMVTITFRK